MILTSVYLKSVGFKIENIFKKENFLKKFKFERIKCKLKMLRDPGP